MKMGDNVTDGPLKRIVGRLREMSRRGYWPLLGYEAADEIMRLRAAYENACAQRAAIGAWVAENCDEVTPNT